MSSPIDSSNHAWIGIIMGGLFTLIWGGLLVLAVLVLAVIVLANA